MAPRELQEEIRAALDGLVPPEIEARIDRLVDDLRAGDLVPGLPVGAVAPDFTLPDALGRPVRLADRLAAGPVVLCFYRGDWCPICSVQLRALQRRLAEITALGATLVAVSPQAPDRSLALAERLELGFDVLSDLDQEVAAAYRIRFPLTGPLRELYEQVLPLPEHNADGSWDLPVPATFVLDAGGVVRASHVDADYRQRMEPDEILAALRTVAAASG